MSRAVRTPFQVGKAAIQTTPLTGTSPPMRQLRCQIEAVGRRACTVLLLGESGSGKELVARHVHAASNREVGPFVPVDCTTLHDSLLESRTIRVRQRRFYRR